MRTPILVAALAELGEGQRVLDIGCGLGRRGRNGPPPWLRGHRHQHQPRSRCARAREISAEQAWPTVFRSSTGTPAACRFRWPFDAIVCVEVAGEHL